MQQREPEKYGQYKDGMPGGADNPLGARAMYLYQGGKDTHIRIHGTNQPQTIGTNSSNGCFRMINEHVMDLYRRVHGRHRRHRHVNVRRQRLRQGRHQRRPFCLRSVLRETLAGKTRPRNFFRWRNQIRRR